MYYKFEKNRSMIFNPLIIVASELGIRDLSTEPPKPKEQIKAMIKAFRNVSDSGIGSVIVELDATVLSLRSNLTLLDFLTRLVPEDSDVEGCSIFKIRRPESDGVEGRSLSVEGGSALLVSEGVEGISLSEVGGSTKIEGFLRLSSDEDLPLLERDLDVAESEGFRSSMSTSAFPSFSSLMLFPECPCSGPMSMSGGTSSIGTLGALTSSSESEYEKE